MIACTNRLPILLALLALACSEKQGPVGAPGGRDGIVLRYVTPRAQVVTSSTPHVVTLALSVSRSDDAGETVPFEGDRNAFTASILELAGSHGVGTLVLAGFMRILGPAAPQTMPNRIVNIHPSLLPAFPGRDAVEQALAAGVKISGVTVHFVDEFVDHGPIIAQEAVPVLVDDTPQSLHVRIQKEEHQLYPRVVEALLEGRLVVNGRSVSWT